MIVHPDFSPTQEYLPNNYTYEYNNVYLIIFRDDTDINFLQDDNAEKLHQELLKASPRRVQEILEEYDVEPQFRHSCSLML